MLINPLTNPAIFATYLYWLALIVVHIFFGLAVYRDAQALERQQRVKLFFVTDGIWGLAALIGGILTVAIYWAMHHSTLCPMTEGIHAEVTNPPILPGSKT